jgi:hypothetical protein
MNRQQLLQNADFLEIAMKQMDDDSVEYEFVEDVYANLITEAEH